MQNTNMMRRTALSAAFLMAATVGLTGTAAAADNYPSRAITMVVGYPAGGSTDLVGRFVADGLASRLGQPVVVENLGGAGGVIGAQKVSKAPADGYTIMVGANNELAIAKLDQQGREVQHWRFHAHRHGRLATHGAGGIAQGRREECRRVHRPGQQEPREVQLRQLRCGHSPAPGR